MRTFTVLAVFLCLGLATAAPLEDLIRTLLKRAEVDKRESHITPPPDKPPPPPPGFLPSEDEYTALEKVGGAISTIAHIAAIGPLNVTDYLNKIEAAIKKSMTGKAMQKAIASKVPKRRPARGREPLRKPPGSGTSSMQEDMFMIEMMDKGLYKTLIDYVGIGGMMLTHIRKVVDYYSKGGPCCETDCVSLPKKVEAILMGMANGKDEDCAWQGETPQEEWSRETPQEEWSQEPPQEEWSQEDSSMPGGEDQAMEGEDLPAQRALIKRLMKALAKSK